MPVLTSPSNSLAELPARKSPVKPLSVRFREDMVARSLTPQMQRNYMDAVVRFVEYYKQFPPGQLNANDVTAYLLHLTITERVSPTDHKTVMGGLRFFFSITLRRPWAKTLGVVGPEAILAPERGSKTALCGSKKRLRERMIEDMTIRGLSPTTHKNYLRFVAQFVGFHGNRPPGQLGPEDVKAYQLHLIRDRNLAHKSVTVAVCALRFFYRVTLNKTWAIDRIVYGKRSRPLPEVPSPENVALLLSCAVRIRHRVMLAAAYGAGLRREEVASLRVNDVDSNQMVLRVVGGKGQKDRLVMLSPGLLLLINEYRQTAKPHHWLFPGCKPDTHLCVDSVGYACREAWKKSGLDKVITIRSLRHAFATRLMENGVQPAVIQHLLGHANLRTTQLYTHVATHTIRSTPSPLDLLPPPPGT